MTDTTAQQDAAFAEWLAAQAALDAARDRFEAACLALYAANHPEDPVARRAERGARTVGPP